MTFVPDPVQPVTIAHSADCPVAQAGFVPWCGDGEPPPGYPTCTCDFGARLRTELTKEIGSMSTTCTCPHFGNKLSGWASNCPIHGDPARDAARAIAPMDVTFTIGHGVAPSVRCMASTDTLRWVIRKPKVFDGFLPLAREKVLQQWWQDVTEGRTDFSAGEWRDVPVVKEE